MRWVDYSGKYGLAYQLSNSLAGMYFNDSTSIILSSDGGKFDYLSATGEATNGNIGQHPPELEKKIKLALRYKGYMTDNLHGAEHPVVSEQISNKVFLADFRRASNAGVSNAVLFRMSDNAVQVRSNNDITNRKINFVDHSKLVLWDEARAVRYVDKRGDVHIWSLGEAVTQGIKGEVIERLKFAAKELFNSADLVTSGKKGRRV